MAAVRYSRFSIISWLFVGTEDNVLGRGNPSAVSCATNVLILVVIVGVCILIVSYASIREKMVWKLIARMCARLDTV